MWTVVYIAPNRTRAQSIKEVLNSEGLLVNLRCLGCNPENSKAIEILVPESEAEEANEIINSILAT